MTPFDAYEISKCREYAISIGGVPSTFIEAIHDDSAPAANTIREFWTLYGHAPGLGVEAICDRDTQSECFSLLSSILGRQVDPPPESLDPTSRIPVRTENS